MMSVMMTSRVLRMTSRIWLMSGLGVVLRLISRLSLVLHNWRLEKQRILQYEFWYVDFSIEPVDLWFGSHIGQRSEPELADAEDCTAAGGRYLVDTVVDKQVAAPKKFTSEFLHTLKLTRKLNFCQRILRPWLWTSEQVIWMNGLHSAEAELLGPLFGQRLVTK